MENEILSQFQLFKKIWKHPKSSTQFYFCYRLKKCRGRLAGQGYTGVLWEMHGFVSKLPFRVQSWNAPDTSRNNDWKNFASENPEKKPIRLVFEPSYSSRDFFHSCHGHLFGQSFASSGCGRCLLQDEGYSVIRPHSFPGSYYMCCRTLPERFRSSPELAGSGKSRQDVIARLKFSFPSYWTPGTSSFWLYLQFP